MVTGISKVASGDGIPYDYNTFELSVDHWEPRSYAAEAGLKAQPTGRKRDALKSLFTKDAAPTGLGNYFGAPPGEGGPWEKFPVLVKGEQKVGVAEMKVGGSGSMKAMDGVVVEQETIRARYVVNCAGGFSDKIAKMIGDDSFNIKPRLGEYVLLKKSSGDACNHILFPCPGPLGKGILVQKTLWGNLILGPTARDQHEWPDPDVDPDSKTDILQKILYSCKKLVPSFDMGDTFHSFAGARAKSDRGDWIIERSAADGSFINVAGIDSPGIAGSPAIALEAVQLLKEAGFSAPADASFNPKRAPIIFPKEGDASAFGELVYTPDDKESVNAAGVAAEANVVCKCEKVTEAEIVEACKRSLPVDSTQAMRKRNRAGMGGCQGKPWNYGCECRVAQIIQRENGYDEAAVVGRRPWKATTQFERRWLNDDDKALLIALAETDPTLAPDAPGLAQKLEEALPLKVDAKKEAEK